MEIVMTCIIACVIILLSVICYRVETKKTDSNVAPITQQKSAEKEDKMVTNTLDDMVSNTFDYTGLKNSTGALYKLITIINIIVFAILGVVILCKEADPFWGVPLFSTSWKYFVLYPIPGFIIAYGFKVLYKIIVEMERIKGEIDVE